MLPRTVPWHMRLHQPEHLCALVRRVSPPSRSQSDGRKIAAKGQPEHDQLACSQDRAAIVEERCDCRGSLRLQRCATAALYGTTSAGPGSTAESMRKNQPQRRAHKQTTSMSRQPGNMSWRPLPLRGDLSGACVPLLPTVERLLIPATVATAGASSRPHPGTRARPSSARQDDAPGKKTGYGLRTCANLRDLFKLHEF